MADSIAWGIIYNRYLRKGRDHGSAAFAADQWEKRQRPDRWKDCPSTHCERRQSCASPHECSAKTMRRARGAISTPDQETSAPE